MIPLPRPLLVLLVAVRAAMIAVLAGPFLLVTTGAALAVCAGEDLRPMLRAEAPDLVAEAERVAEAMPNGAHRLWRVTTPNGRSSHLYGTMHVSDPAVVALSAEAQAAYDAAEIVVIETTDVLNEQAAAASMMTRPDLMSFTDGRSLLDFMDDADEAMLDTALRERGMSLAAVKSLKPWILLGVLAMPECELSARDDFLDLALARGALDEGRPVEGLETAVEQLEAMASLPLQMHVDGLVDSAMLGERMDDVFRTMGLLYKEGRIGAIWPFIQAASAHLAPGSEMEEAAMVAFEEAVVTARNRTMAERAAPLLDAGSAFVAVGALHIPGEEGLVELLREAGYAVEPVAR